MFARNRNDVGLHGQRITSGLGTHEMAGPSAMLRGFEKAQQMGFNADQYDRRVREQDSFLATPGMSRFSMADRMQNRAQDQLHSEAYRQLQRQEQQQANMQAMLMAPFRAELDANNRARALGYNNAASQRELASSREFSRAQQASLLAGLAAMFAPFAQSGASQSTSISQLLGGLLDDTDITMRDNAMNPIGGVMARFRRPASNTYGAT